MWIRGETLLKYTNALRSILHSHIDRISNVQIYTPLVYFTHFIFTHRTHKTRHARDPQSRAASQFLRHSPHGTAVVSIPHAHKHSPPILLASSGHPHTIPVSEHLGRFELLSYAFIIACGGVCSRSPPALYISVALFASRDSS